MCRFNYEEEYRQLAEEVRHRGLEHSTAQSILVTGSLLAVIYALQSSNELGRIFTALIIVIAIGLVLLALLMYYTTKKLDDLFMTRIKQIEPKIPIEKGYLGLSQDILNKRWYKVRQGIWPFLFTFLLIFYIIMFVIRVLYIN